MKWMRRKWNNVIEAIEDSGTSINDIKTIFWETNKLLWSIMAIFMVVYFIMK